MLWTGNLNMHSWTVPHPLPVASDPPSQTWNCFSTIFQQLPEKTTHIFFYFCVECYFKLWRNSPTWWICAFFALNFICKTWGSRELQKAWMLMLYNSCERDRKWSGSDSDSGMNYWRNNNITVWWIISAAAGSLSWCPPGLFLLLSCIQKNDLIPGIYKRKCHILSNQIQSSVFFEALLEL